MSLSMNVRAKLSNLLPELHVNQPHGGGVEVVLPNGGTVRYRLAPGSEWRGELRDADGNVMENLPDVPRVGLPSQVAERIAERVHDAAKIVT